MTERLPSRVSFKNLSCVYLLFTRILRCLIFSLSWSSSHSVLGERTLYMYIWWTIFYLRFRTFINRSWLRSLIDLNFYNTFLAGYGSETRLLSLLFISGAVALLMQVSDSSWRCWRMIKRFWNSGWDWSWFIPSMHRQNLFRENWVSASFCWGGGLVGWDWKFSMMWIIKNINSHFKFQCHGILEK